LRSGIDGGRERFVGGSEGVDVGAALDFTLKFEGWYLPLGIVRASGTGNAVWETEVRRDGGVGRVVSEGEAVVEEAFDILDGDNDLEVDGLSYAARWFLENGLVFDWFERISWYGKYPLN
jgi:hypothetical protein